MLELSVCHNIMSLFEVKVEYRTSKFSVHIDIFFGGVVLLNHASYVLIVTVVTGRHDLHFFIDKTSKPEGFLEVLWQIFLKLWWNFIRRQGLLFIPFKLDFAIFEHQQRIGHKHAEHFWPGHGINLQPLPYIDHIGQKALVTNKFHWFRLVVEDVLRQLLVDLLDVIVSTQGSHSIDGCNAHSASVALIISPFKLGQLIVGKTTTGHYIFTFHDNTI
jgi:hypothetical protein